MTRSRRIVRIIAIFAALIILCVTVLLVVNRVTRKTTQSVVQQTAAPIVANLCTSGNISRASDLAIWKVIASPGLPTPLAERASLALKLAEIKDAQRDCTTGKVVTTTTTVQGKVTP